MTQNFEASYLDRLSGWRTIRLSLAGGTAFEQRLTLEIALATGRVRRVIWGLDWFSFARPVDGFRRDLGQFPTYFYENHPIGLGRYYVFNLRTLERSVAVLRGRGETDLDRLNNWSARYQFGCQQVHAALQDTSLAERTRASIRSGDFILDRAAVEQNLQRNVLDVTRSHPAVEFVLFLPPYSLWFYDYLRGMGPEYIGSFASLRSILTEEQLPPNVRLVDFQVWEEVVTDPGLYKDLTHYSEAVSRQILEALVPGGHLPEGIAKDAEMLRNHLLSCQDSSLAPPDATAPNAAK